MFNTHNVITLLNTYYKTFTIFLQPNYNKLCNYSNVTNLTKTHFELSLTGKVQNLSYLF